MLIYDELLGVCKWLNAVLALQEERVTNILMDLSICGISCFQSMF